MEYLSLCEEHTEDSTCVPGLCAVGMLFINSTPVEEIYDTQQLALERPLAMYMKSELSRIHCLARNRPDPDKSKAQTERSQLYH